MHRAILATALVGLVFGCGGCGALRHAIGADLQPPRFTFDSWSAQVDLEGATLLLVFQVENPNPKDLHLAGARYALELDGRRAASGELPGGADFPAQATTPLTVPVRIRFQDLPPLLGMVFGRDSIPYRVTGTAQVRTPIGLMEIPFEHADRLTLPRD